MTGHPKKSFRFIHTKKFINDSFQFQIRKHYYAMLAEVDEMVGQVVKAIPANKRENTIILFTSDHGDLAMEHR